MVAIPKPIHKRRVPKKGNRGNFSRSVRNQVYERDNGQCRQCGAKGEEIHHVYFKSRGGRGVFTNGLTLCHSCHRKVHMSAENTQYWIDRFTEEYGEDFYKDEWDQ